MNKQEVIKILEKKRETALDNSEYYRDKENEKYEKMNRARVDSYTLAIQLVEQIDEPQAEKVEVPDFVAEWYESHENNLNQAIYDATIDSYDHRHKTEFEEWFIDSRNDTYGTLIRMKDGYTVKPKRWVVKNDRGYVAMENFKDFKNQRVGVKLTITGEKSESLAWDDVDLEKAEAVAVLVEGTVEEV